VWDAPASLLDILQQIEDAVGLENKVRLSKELLAEVFQKVEDSQATVLTSTSHPEVPLFRWFTDLRTTVPISTKMCLGFLKMLGPKLAGVVASNHRLALESPEVRASTELAQTAFAKLTRLHLIAEPKDDGNIAISKTEVREAMVSYITIMFERSELWKSAIIISCIPDPWRIERNSWSLRVQGKDESAAGYREYISIGRLRCVST
jgi:hypothetical protein